MTTQSKFSWRRAPIPWDRFPAGSGGGLRLGMPWKWFVAADRGGREPTLFATDPRKEEHRIWQCRTDGDATTLLLRVEHHGAAPGWHAHSPAGSLTAFAGDRHPVPSEQFPAVSAAGLWRVSEPEEQQPAFPAEPMSGDTVAELTELLDTPFEDVTVRPVPFGLAVGLPGRQTLGDSLAVYVSQLGRETPLFRLEDDGMTIPALQCSGALAATDYVLPHEILGAHTKGRTHFSPDLRTLFTPHFPADELSDRLAEFAQALSTYAAILNAYESNRAESAKAPRRQRAADDGRANPAPAAEKRGGSPLPNGNAWTRAASYVTV